MMASIFAAMALASAGALMGPRRFAVAAAMVCLVLSIGLFLFEIHDAAEGFRMPWLQVRGHAPIQDRAV